MGRAQLGTIGRQARRTSRPSGTTHYVRQKSAPRRIVSPSADFPSEEHPTRRSPIAPLAKEAHRATHGRPCGEVSHARKLHRTHKPHPQRASTTHVHNAHPPANGKGSCDSPPIPPRSSRFRGSCGADEAEPPRNAPQNTHNSNGAPRKVRRKARPKPTRPRNHLLRNSRLRKHSPEKHPPNIHQRLLRAHRNDEHGEQPPGKAPPLAPPQNARTHRISA